MWLTSSSFNVIQFSEFVGEKKPKQNFVCVTSQNDLNVFFHIKVRENSEFETRIFFLQQQQDAAVQTTTLKHNYRIHDPNNSGHSCYYS